MTTLTNSTSPDVNTAVASAVTAFEKLRRFTPAERARLLDAIADSLDANTDTLIPLAHQETHLPVARLHGELARTTFQLRSFANLLHSGDFSEPIIDRAKTDTPLGATPDLRRHLLPVGPVAMFSASNFPFAFSVAGGDTASAIAAGCPVIVKAHSGHPRLSQATKDTVTAALYASGAPDGVLGIVYGQQAGVTLLEDPRIAAGAFTGSTAGGRALFDLAAARPRPIPFYGELGSVNPVVVTREASTANAASIAAGLVESFTLGGGQFCTKPGVIFVPSGSTIAEFATHALEQTPAQRLLNDRIASAYDDAESGFHGVTGVETLVLGTRSAEGFTPSLFRTSLTSLLKHRETLLEERFGPSTLIVEYPPDQRLADLLLPFEGTLTVTVHGVTPADIDVAETLDRASLIAGRVLWNQWPTGVAISPAMTHGGPFPSSTNASHTSVGTTAIRRFQRPVTYQNLPDAALPPDLQNANPLGLARQEL